MYCLVLPTPHTVCSVQDLLMQYLQLKLGFNTRDQANLLVIVAGCGLAIKLALLPGKGSFAAACF